MEENICGFDSSEKHRLKDLLKYQSGSCIKSEDIKEEGDDEMEVDYQCPFCSDDYNLAELCHHIDEEHHHLDANNGVCPVCSRRVKMHMVDHITTQHRDVLKGLYKDESYSALSPETKKYLQSLIDGPLSINHTSRGVPDSFLSFVYNPPSPNQPKLVLPDLSSGVNTQDKSLFKDSTEKEGTELLEKAKKREFVQGLVSSAMFSHTEDF